ncbi:MAG TPA: packaged DNA stabilization protein [Candidatus Babeliaceae bacterium]|nr:packaged DNA stabilization protein [Candidatus Babeliaceae bacterium]
MRFIGFIGPTYQARSKNVDNQRCVNLYPEMDELGTGKEREVASLVSTPGLKFKVTAGTGPIRGLYTASNGRVFAASGSTLYEVNSDFTVTSRGTLYTDTGMVSMSDNGIDLFLVDGSDTGYHMTFSSNTFATKTSADNFLGADVVAFMDGYLIFNDRNTEFFYITDAGNLTFDSSYRFPCEGSPDNLVTIIANNRELWMFNEYTTEVFFDAGDQTQPFQRIQGAFIEHGCAAKFSAVKINNTVFWLGNDLQGTTTVYMANGYLPQRISTTAIDLKIQSYSTVSDAVAYGYHQDGHNFYVLNFPTEDATWVYDTATGLWHERAYFDGDNLVRHRGQCHAFGFNTHLIGDWENGNIYALDKNYYYDDYPNNRSSSPIVRLRRAPHITQSLDRLFYSCFQLDMQVGIGDGTTGQGSDPMAILRFSDDAGNTWSNEKWASMGKQGKYKTRVQWQRLGSARDRIFEVRISDPNPITLIGAEIDVIKGDT